jgi:hypothetical protein
MLPRKLHLEQVNRFHDMIDSVNKQIKELKDEPKEKKYPLMLKYFHLVNDIWPTLDDSLEDLKFKLDELERNE